jgi:hypothetical protein
MQEACEVLQMHGLDLALLAAPWMSLGVDHEEIRKVKEIIDHSSL